MSYFRHGSISESEWHRRFSREPGSLSGQVHPIPEAAFLKDGHQRPGQRLCCLKPDGPIFKAAFDFLTQNHVFLLML